MPGCTGIFTHVPLFRVLGALFVVAVLTACGNSNTSERQQDKEEPAEAEQFDHQSDLQQGSVQLPKLEHRVNYDSLRVNPETCYTAFRFAWMLGDYGKAFELLTPRAQRELAANVLGCILTIEVHARGYPENPNSFLNDGATPENKALARLLSQVMKKRGSASANELFDKHYGANRAELDRQVLLEHYDKTLLAMTNEIGQFDVFMSELVDLLKTRDSKDLNNSEVIESLYLDFDRIVDIVIEGDRARGWQASKSDDYGDEYAVFFILKDSGWLIDHAIPNDGRYFRSGGIYRDQDGVIHNQD